MRRRLTVMTLALIVASGLWAQDKEKKVQDPAESKELNQEAYIRLLRTDLKTKKEQIVKEEMQLNDQQAAAFWPIYRNYDAEQTALGDQKLAIINEYAQSFLSMNDVKADQLAQKVMALDEQRLALRKKYYELMKKALPAVVVVRFFQVENQMQLLADLQIAANLPIVEAAQ